MFEQFIKSIVTALISAGVIDSPNDCQGVAPESIATFETSGNITLPKYYKAFLSGYGEKCGSFMDGYRFYWKDIKKNQEYFSKLRSEDQVKFKPNDSHFVFICLQGEQFMFFDLTEGDDPPVYFFMEDEGKPRKVADKFSEWLFKTINTQGVRIKKRKASVEIIRANRDKRRDIELDKEYWKKEE